MGQGMILISPTPEDVIKVAKEHGIEAKVIGQITKEPGIQLASKGTNAKKEAWLRF
jgi:phosphoribosylaminoimidazole (AIR) synthetase